MFLVIVCPYLVLSALKVGTKKGYNFWVLDCWLDKRCNMKTPIWPLVQAGCSHLMGPCGVNVFIKSQLFSTSSRTRRQWHCLCKYVTVNRGCNFSLQVDRKSIQLRDWSIPVIAIREATKSLRACQRCLKGRGGAT